MGNNFENLERNGTKQARIFYEGNNCFFSNTFSNIYKFMSQFFFKYTVQKTEQTTL